MWEEEKERVRKRKRWRAEMKVKWATLLIAVFVPQAHTTEFGEGKAEEVAISL